MLNERIANTPLLCGDDIEDILQCAGIELSDYMSNNDRDLVTANEIGRIFLEKVESHISWAVEAMRQIRK